MDFELGERPIDSSHDWRSDAWKYTSLTLRGYQKFLEKRKNQKYNRPFKHLEPTDWFTLTKSQKEVLSIVDSYLKKPKDEAEKNPLKLLCLGSAGTGKSLLIKRIAKRLEQEERKYFLAAPTGVAACNISGVSLHSLLSIPYHKSDSFECIAQHCVPSSTLKNKLNGLEFIIVDEISMVGGGFLQFISASLKKVFEKDTDFASVSVILVGDITQLTPVFDSPIYKDPNIVKPFVGEGIKLYQTFQPTFLRESSRHEYDEEFRNLLYNIRRKNVSEDDLNLLRSRQEKNLAPDELVDFTEAIHIFPYNNLVHAYNRKRLAQLNVPLVKIPVKQTPKFPIITNNEPLILGKGVRVMLTKNLDIKNSIVNGSLGQIEAILWDKRKRPGKDLPSVILVKFDQKDVVDTVENGAIPIKPCIEYQFDQFTGKNYKIESFSLRVAYASTTHKIQGITLDKAVVYLSRREAFVNQTYVALSRTRSLQDIVILDEELSLDRFSNFAFYKDFKEQKQEFKRLGIYDEVIGEDKQGFEPNNIPTLPNSPENFSKQNAVNNWLHQNQIDENLDAVDTLRDEWMKELNDRLDCKPTSPILSNSLAPLPGIQEYDSTLQPNICELFKSEILGEN